MPPFAALAARLRPALLAVGLALALAAPVGALAAEDEGFGMNDIGATLYLPKGWEMQKWADWEFKAKSADGVLLRMYLTPFQADIDEDNGKAWLAMYEGRLTEEGGSRYAGGAVQVGTATLQGGASVPVVRSTLGFSFEKQGMDGVLHAVALQGRGQVIHLEAIAAARNGAKAQAGLDALLAGLRLDKLPAETTGPRVASEKAEFAFTAPAGWRAPLELELEAVLKITEKLGEGNMPPDKCAVAIRPPATGDPDVVYACTSGRYLDPVDEESFADVEKELNQLFFAKAPTPVPPGEKIQAGDRLGFLFQPSAAGKALRMGIAPYNHGIVHLWAIGDAADDATVDASARAALGSLEYTAPDGGLPIVAIDRRIVHAARYNPTSPLILGPVAVLLLVVGGIVAYIMKENARKKRLLEM